MRDVSDRRESGADSTVVGVVVLVALTAVLAGSVFMMTSDFGLPDTRPVFDEGRSPFAVEVVEGTLVGSPDDTGLYDSSTGDVSKHGFLGERRPPVLVDEGVDEKISSFRGSPSPPDPFVTNELRITSGDYHVDSTVTWWSWSNGRVVFDTSRGPVRVAVSEGGRISADGVRFDVEGSHPVEFYVERSNIVASDFYVYDSTFENHRTDAFRIYGQSESAGDSADVFFEETEFRGIVYAPGAEVEFEDSTVHGASVADETRLDGSSYYHDTHLERLGTEVLP